MISPQRSHQRIDRFGLPGENLHRKLNTSFSFRMHFDFLAFPDRVCLNCCHRAISSLFYHSLSQRHDRLYYKYSLTECTVAKKIMYV
jgi:hypothetical protein